MTKLHAMPGELAAGILGRLRNLLGFDSARETVAYLRSISSVDPEFGARRTVFEILARTLDMSTVAFARGHSMIPVLRAVGNGQEFRLHGDQSESNTLRYFGMAKTQQRSYLCQSCADKDYQKARPSYWRLRHQIYGLTTCRDHFVALRYVDHRNAFDFHPEHLLEASREHPIGFGVSEDPFVERYISIMTGFLEFDRPIPAANLATLLRQRAESVGIRLGSHQQGVLSDLIVQTAPSVWLRMYFPNIIDKAKGGNVASIDGLIRVRNVSVLAQNYALVSALLWDDSEAALDRISNCSLANPPVAKKFTDCGWNYWTHKEIFEAYVKNMGNIRAVARQMDVHEAYAGAQLQRYGYPALGSCSWEREISAIRAYFRGSSLQEACDEFGASIRQVDKLLRSAGAIFSRALDAMGA